MFFQGYDQTHAGIGTFAMLYDFWSADQRLIVDKVEVSENLPDLYPDQMCNLVVQIVLDITEVGDSLVCKSWSVFDFAKSVYLYDDTPDVESYFNIYFDICEIERRKLQKKLDEKKHTLSEINEIYNLTKAEIDMISKQFYSETDRGHDEKSIKKWNKYVLENLGIDNLKLVKNTEQNKN